LFVIFSRGNDSYTEQADPNLSLHLFFAVLLCRLRDFNETANVPSHLNLFGTSFAHFAVQRYGTESELSLKQAATVA
jgi:hypothetical protein